jgi:hypothetical protein
MASYDLYCTKVLSMMIAVDTPPALPITSSTPTTEPLHSSAPTKRSITTATTAAGVGNVTAMSDTKTDGLAPRSLQHYERTYTCPANKEGNTIHTLLHIIVASF